MAGENWPGVLAVIVSLITALTWPAHRFLSMGQPRQPSRVELSNTPTQTEVDQRADDIAREAALREEQRRARLAREADQAGKSAKSATDLLNGKLNDLRKKHPHAPR